jgi:hypothetical protein
MKLAMLEDRVFGNKQEDAEEREGRVEEDVEKRLWIYT